MTDLTRKGKPMYRKDSSLTYHALKEDYVQRCRLGSKGFAEMYLEEHGYGFNKPMIIVRGFDHKLSFFFKEFSKRAEGDEYWRQLRRSAERSGRTNTV